MTTVKLNKKAFGDQIMRGPLMKAEMARRGALVLSAAQAAAPVGKRRTNRPRYKDSFAPVSVSVGRADYTKWDLMGRRAYATVANTSPQARHVEYGGGKQFGGGKSPRFRVLGKALNAARG